MTVIDDINRLFDELIRDRWSRSAAGRSRAPTRPAETYLEFDVPLAGGQLGGVSIAVRDRQLVVRTRRRRAESAAEPGADDQVERVLLLPLRTEVSAVEARVVGDVLHVRVQVSQAVG